MSTSTLSTPLQLDSIMVTDESLIELDNGRAAVWVPHAEVVLVTLRSAPAAESPTIVGVVGAALCLVSLYPIYHLLQMMTYGGRMPVALFGLCAFAVAGVWMLRLALRRRLLLEVTTPRRRRKLIFQGKVAPEEADRFLREAGNRYGWQVKSEV